MLRCVHTGTLMHTARRQSVLDAMSTPAAGGLTRSQRPRYMAQALGRVFALRSMTSLQCCSKPSVYTVSVL